MTLKSTLHLFIAFLISMGFILVSPSSSYATRDRVYVPSEGRISRFEMPVKPGCMFDIYTIYPLVDNSIDSVDLMLGTNSYEPEDYTSTDPTLNCNFTLGTSGGSEYHLTQINAGSNGANNYRSYNGFTVTNDVYTKLSGNNNPMNVTVNYTTSKNIDFYNSIHNIIVSLNSSTNSSNNVILPVSPDSAAYNVAYAYYLLSFKLPDTAQVVGTQFTMLPSSFVPSADYDIDSEDLAEYLRDSTYSFCSTDSDLDNLVPGFSDIFPDYEVSLTNNYNNCYVIGAIPMSKLGTLKVGASGSGNYIYFESLSSIYYENFYSGDDRIDLSNYGYPFYSVFRSPSYKNMNSGFDGSLKFIDPYFEITWCTDSDQCFDDSSFYATLSSLHDESINADSNHQNNASGFNFWNNIFMFGLTFPFTSMFNLFTNPGNCASIPTLASWVHSNESTYCTWWPSNVVSTLTPIFGVLSLMVLFGFIVSWLRGDRANVLHSPGRSV